MLKIMIIIRLISSLLELTAAYLMYYFNNIETALKINAFWGLIGPIVLILVSFFGLIGISSQLNIKKLFLISLGIILILLGTY